MTTIQNYDEIFFQNKKVTFVGKLGGMTRREAKRLVQGYSGTVIDEVNEADLIVIGADELPLAASGDLLSDHLQDLAAKGTIEIISETQLWQNLGLIENEKNVHKLYTPAMLAELIGVSVHKVRRWHRRGLIVPAREVRKLPYFDFLEVSTARNLAQLVAAGISPKTIEKKLAQLAQFVPDVQRPLAQLSIILEGKQILLRDGEGLVEPGGQRRIDFELFENEIDSNIPSSTLRLPERKESTTEKSTEQSVTTIEDMIASAEAFEDDCQFQSAVEMYRAMLMAFGPSAEINFQLAELLYRMGDSVAARERYYMSIELEEEFVEARANLGCVLAELGHTELAVAAFQGALAFHPEYPDVHFHLARLFEELEDKQQAQFHSQKFLELSPKSPWAQEAEVRLTDEVLSE